MSVNDPSARETSILHYLAWGYSKRNRHNGSGPGFPASDEAVNSRRDWQLCHSSRRADTGFIRVARRSGMKHDAITRATMKPAILSSVGGALA